MGTELIQRMQKLMFSKENIYRFYQQCETSHISIQIQPNDVSFSMTQQSLQIPDHIQPISSNDFTIVNGYVVTEDDNDIPEIEVKEEQEQINPCQSSYRTDNHPEPEPEPEPIIQQKSHIQPHSELVEPVEQMIEPEPQKHTHQTRGYIPYENDCLFWCFFIAYKGMDEYLLHKTHTFKIEKEFKINSVSLLREYKTQLKALKLNVNDIEENLVHHSKLSVPALHALCFCYKVSVLFVGSNTYTYQKFYYGDNLENIYRIHTWSKPQTQQSMEHKHHHNNHKPQHNAMVYLTTTQNDMDTIYSSYYCIVSSQKLLNAFSSYSLPQMKEIAEKLQIHTTYEIAGHKPNKPKIKSKTKKELYEEIYNFIQLEN
jgi:hypothetical protein